MNQSLENGTLAEDFNMDHSLEDGSFEEAIRLSRFSILLAKQDENDPPLFLNANYLLSHTDGSLYTSFFKNRIP